VSIPNIKKLAFLIGFVSVLTLNISLSWSQELQFHVLSPFVQITAIKNNVFATLTTDHPEIKGAEMIDFYLDVMTFADVVGLERARISRRPPDDNDFILGFSLECLIPFGPVHEKRKGKIKEIRRKMVKDAYTIEAKRKNITDSINVNLIKESKDALISKNLGLFEVMDVNKLLK
jgi:hypothetical protein